MAKVVGFDEKFKQRVSCKNCAAIVEYVESEVVKKQTYSWGETGTTHYLNCPNCSKDIVVKDW